MKTNKRGWGWMVAVGLALTAWGCGGGSGGGAGHPAITSAEIGPGGGTITSPDGKMKLTIPAGALGNTETITIESVDPATLPTSLDGAKPDFAFEMKPDGLQFSQPVEVSLKLDDFSGQSGRSLDGGLVLLFTSSGATIEPLEQQGLDIDLSDGTATVTGQVSHFSTLQGIIAPGVTVTLALEKDIVLKFEAFNVTATVAKSAESTVKVDRVLYEDESESPLEVAVFDEGGEDLGNFRQDGAKTVQKVFRYTCLGAGLGRYRAGVALQTLDIDLLLDLGSQLHQTFTTQYRIRGETNVICQEVGAEDGRTTGTEPGSHSGPVGLFSVGPVESTHPIGESFEVKLTEDLVGTTERFEIAVTDLHRNIVSAPKLSGSTGASETTLTPLVQSPFGPQDRIDVKAPSQEQDNTQTLQYTCRKEGDTALEITLKMFGANNELLGERHLVALIHCRTSMDGGTGGGDTGGGEETGQFSNPFAEPPQGALAWKVVNPEIGHEDGPFALPGADNPNNNPVLSPGDGPWSEGEECGFIHLHGPFYDGTSPPQFHDDPAPIGCGHGGLVYLF